MRILAVTIVYQPEPELLLRSVASYAGAVEKVLVWRNSPLPGSLESDLSSVDGGAKVSLCGDGSNAGIPAGLNAAWKEAAADGFDAVLTMDQDSVWHGFPDFLKAVDSPDAPAGFYAPSAVHPTAVPASGPGGVFTPCETAFTSGMLVPVPVLERVGGWCEDFRIDGVDNEFCLHAKSLGIPLFRVSSGWLEHALGKVVIRRFLGLRFRTYNYPPERLYGIYRNNLLAIKKYPAVSKNFRRQFYRTWLWRRPLRMLLGERNLKAKFAAIRKGIRDAKLS